MLSRSFDFARWAVVSFKDDTGLGRMAEDIRNVLGLERQIVIPSERLETKALSIGDRLLDPGSPTPEVEAALDGLDGLILLERPGWHPELVVVARRLGIAVAVVLMWEWFQPKNPLWKQCDLLICPNEIALATVRSHGYDNAVLLPWTLDLKRFPVRRISGPARLFVHNGGLMDSDDRKGTIETIRAFEGVRHPDVRLLVRLQVAPRVSLHSDDPRIEVRIGNVPELHEVYGSGEAAIQPSKLEGIGFMVLEPIACGIPTVTQDVAPMREYAPGATLLSRPRWLAKKAFSSAWAPHSRLRVPDVRAMTRLIEQCAREDLASRSRASREWAERVFDPESLRHQWISTLERLKTGFTPKPFLRAMT